MYMCVCACVCKYTGTYRRFSTAHWVEIKLPNGPSCQEHRCISAGNSLGLPGHCQSVASLTRRETVKTVMSFSLGPAK